MKSYTITVNGNVYEVTVEENTGNTAQRASAPVTPKAAPAKASAPAQTPAAKPAGAEGSIKITSPMPGKILGIKAQAGQAVSKGQVIIVLEAMKMENEIVAPQDGTVASINVSVGGAVEAGVTLATLN